MGKLRVAGLVAAVALLVASTALGAAGDKRLSLSGTLDDDASTKAKLTVVKRHRAPRSVQNVRFRNLLMDCREGPTRVQLRLSKAAAVGSDRRFEKVYEADKKHRVKLEGKVREDGKRLRAKMTGTTVKIDGAGECKVPTAKFTVKKG